MAARNSENKKKGDRGQDISFKGVPPVIYFLQPGTISFSPFRYKHT